MTSGHVLELLSLPTMHPQCGDALLEQCALSLIVRLSIDPTRLAKGMMSREVSVNWLATPDGVELREERTVSWAGALAGREAAFAQWHYTVPAQDITEEAAIAIAGLLLHEYVHGVILGALRIGSGGDYLVQGHTEQFQIECSGLRLDANGSRSKTRLADKKGQVISKCDKGLASVTIFSHSKNEAVHSYLHCVHRESEG